MHRNSRPKCSTKAYTLPAFQYESPGSILAWDQHCVAIGTIICRIGVRSVTDYTTAAFIKLSLYCLLINPIVQWVEHSN